MTRISVIRDSLLCDTVRDLAMTSGSTDGSDIKWSALSMVSSLGLDLDSVIQSPSMQLFTRIDSKHMA